MRTWTILDAKARFSELLDTCLAEGPQYVTRHGVEAAVLVPIDTWRRLHDGRPSLKFLLMAPGARGDLLVPPRGRASRRSATPRP